MLLAAATLTFSISLEVDFTKLLRQARLAEVRGLRCGIATVGYRFVGAPGQSFRYDGATYVIPAGGWIELVSRHGRDREYETAGRTLPLEVWPRDHIGFRIVPMPGRATP
jgi:hypothetical protein